MRTSFLAAIVLVAALVVVGTIVFLWPGTPGGSGVDSAAATPEAAGAAADGPRGEEAAAAREDGVETRISIPPAQPADGGEHGRTGLFLAGSVVDKKSGAPVRAFGIELSARNESTGRSTLLFYREFRDDAGRFFLPLERGGPYYICVHSSSHEAVHGVEAEVPEGESRDDLRVELDPGKTISGRVVDADTGAPVAGATVFDYHNARLYQIVTGSPNRARHTVTGKDGTFTLSGLEGGWVLLAAVHPDHAAAHLKTAPGGAEALIALGQGHRIFGRVLDDGGRPCPGIVVDPTDVTPGEETRYGIERPVLSGEDGRFRTAPLNASPTEVKAYPPRDEDGAAVAAGKKAAFTAEEKSVELADRDVELDFGPSPLFTTWRGAIVDRTGMPPARARIYCMLIDTLGEAPPFWTSPSAYRHTSSQEDGTFEQHKLLPGLYQVEVAFGPSYTPRENRGLFTFESPGIVEKNIVITGGSLRGTVIDEATGSRPSGPLHLEAERADDSRKRRNTTVDDAGGFVFRGVSPGSYTLRADLRRENRRGAVENVEVVEGRLVDGICIRIPPGEAQRGRVIVQLFGCEDLSGAPTHLRFSDATHRNRLNTNLRLQPEGGVCTWKDNHLFEEGSYTVEVSISDCGRAEKRFDVVKGRTTTVQFFRSDFETVDDRFVAEGTVKKAGGGPLAGARVDLDSLDLLGPDQEKSLEAETDAEGRFRIEGLIPGTWTVRVSLANGGRKECALLRIPGDAAPIVPLHIVLHGGSVSAALVDGRTGAPIDPETARWRALLLSTEKEYRETYWRRPLEKTDDWIVRIDGAAGESHLSAAGVAAGTYILRIEAEGYFDYTSEPVPIAEGQSLDLGTISLEPGGILIAEAVDPQGIPLRRFFVDFPDLDHSPKGRTLPDGRRKCWKIPFGENRIYVEANGFEGRAATITFRPGVAEELRVVLKPE